MNTKPYVQSAAVMNGPESPAFRSVVKEAAQFAKDGPVISDHPFMVRNPLEQYLLEMWRRLPIEARVELLSTATSGAGFNKVEPKDK